MEEKGNVMSYEEPAIAFGTGLPKTWSRRHTHLIKMFAKGRKYRQCEPFTLHDKMIIDERMCEGTRIGRLSWMLAHHPKGASFPDFHARQYALARWVGSEACEIPKAKRKMTVAQVDLMVADMRKAGADRKEIIQAIREVDDGNHTLLSHFAASEWARGSIENHSKYTSWKP